MASENKNTVTTSLLVDSFVDSRTQDIAAHFPPTDVPRIPRDFRRRATSNVRVPFYLNKNNPKRKHGGDARYKYLVLHNWYSKRMQLSPLWGWMIPLSHNQRAVSSCLKLLSRRQVVHDLSYTETFVLKGEPSYLASLLNYFSHNSYRDSSLQSLPFYYLSNGASYFIGLIDVLMETLSSYLLLIHPSIADVVSSMVSEHLNESTSFTQCQLGHIAIRGQHPEELLKSLYPNYEFSDNPLSFTVFRKPSPQCPYYAPEYYSSDSDLHPPPRVYFPPKQQFKGHQYHKSTTQKENEKEEPLSVPSTEWISWLLESHSSTQFPSLIIQYKVNTWGGKKDGYDVLLPLQGLKLLWPLVYESNTLILSLDEWHAVHTFYGIPLFPFDSPDTPSGMEILSKLYSSPYEPLAKADPYATTNAVRVCMEAAMEAESTEALVPVKMGSKIKVEHCFYLVSLRIKGCGSMKVPCAIREATDDDLKLDYSKHFIPPANNRIIGFVTSSVYSPKASCYVAIGFCLASSLKQCMITQKSHGTCIVLVSNDSSLSSHFARLTLLRCNVCWNYLIFHFLHYVSVDVTAL